MYNFLSGICNKLFICKSPFNEHTKGKTKRRENDKKLILHHLQELGRWKSSKLRDEYWKISIDFIFPCFTGVCSMVVVVVMVWECVCTLMILPVSGHMWVAHVSGHMWVAHVRGCLHVCACGLMLGTIPGGFFPPYSGRQVAKSNPELTDMASLPNQLALGIIGLHPARLKLQVGCHIQLAYMSF